MTTFRLAIGGCGSYRRHRACLPSHVAKVHLRSDTAAPQQDLLLYCGEGPFNKLRVRGRALWGDRIRDWRGCDAGVPPGGTGDAGGCVATLASEL